MKFLVLSDTHGKTENVEAIYHSLNGIDAVIHLGDYEKDADEIAKKLGCDVISVRGNMDGGFTENEFKLLDTEYGKLLLTHGHMQHVKGSLQSLIYFAEEHECKAALFGHTHRALNEDLNGLHLLNPGSLSLPADDTRGSYAVLTTSKDSFVAEIFRFSGTEKKDCAKAKPKVKGGFIRNLLNNSDRF